jgi:hypothetical protein
MRRAFILLDTGKKSAGFSMVYGVLVGVEEKAMWLCGSSEKVLMLSIWSTQLMSKEPFGLFHGF